MLSLQGFHPENSNSKNITEWEKLRYEKVTGSCPPAFLGIFGNSKFEDY